MSTAELIRAWKDPEFRATLGDAMVDHPAGQMEVADRGLENADEKLGLAAGTFVRAGYCGFPPFSHGHGCH